MLAENRWRQVEAELQVAELPERPGLLQPPELDVLVGDGDPGRPVDLGVEEPLLPVLPDQLGRHSCAGEGGEQLVHVPAGEGGDETVVVVDTGYRPQRLHPVGPDSGDGHPLLSSHRVDAITGVEAGLLVVELGVRRQLVGVEQQHRLAVRLCRRGRAATT